MKQTYRPALSLYETQSAIGIIKQCFPAHLTRQLRLTRATAPLFVDPTTGLNDDLNGVERPVSFDIPAIPELEKGTGGAQPGQVEAPGTGPFRFRPGHRPVCGHERHPPGRGTGRAAFGYVDQWDWEKVITHETRTEEYLKDTVRSIVSAICATLEEVKKAYPQLCVSLSEHVSFVTTQQLEDLWPDLTPHQRENAYVEQHPTAFIMQTGAPLASGKPHDGRAPDYDDWSLNGDLLSGMTFWAVRWRFPAWASG